MEIKKKENYKKDVFFHTENLTCWNYQCKRTSKKPYDQPTGAESDAIWVFLRNAGLRKVSGQACFKYYFSRQSAGQEY